MADSAFAVVAENTVAEKTVTESIVAEGKYYWEKIFDYDNRENKTAMIEHSYTEIKEKTVRSKEFISRKFKIDTGFKYGSEVSTTVKFEGIADATAKVSWNFHLETSEELQKTSETDKTVAEKTTAQRIYKIPAGDKMALWQLCYVLESGVTLKTENFQSHRGDDETVKLRFSLLRRILGLPEILTLFTHTTPGSSNREEWTTIRDSIIANTNQPALAQFRNFVSTLGKIEPGGHNVVEWAAIRKTCGEILGEWGDPNSFGKGPSDKQLLLKKLLARFSATKPGHHNRDEWAEIRDLSDKILAGLRDLPYS